MHVHIKYAKRTEVHSTPHLRNSSAGRKKRRSELSEWNSCGYTCGVLSSYIFVSLLHPRYYFVLCTWCTTRAKTRWQEFQRSRAHVTWRRGRVGSLFPVRKWVEPALYASAQVMTYGLCLVLRASKGEKWREFYSAVHLPTRTGCYFQFSLSFIYLRQDR